MAAIFKMLAQARQAAVWKSSPSDRDKRHLSRTWCTRCSQQARSGAGKFLTAQADGRRSRPFCRDCCQHCCRTVGRRRSHADTFGMLAQYKATDVRSWTMCPLLRIRCSRACCVPELSSRAGERVRGSAESHRSRTGSVNQFVNRTQRDRLRRERYRGPGTTSRRRSAEVNAVTRDGPGQRRRTSVGS